MRNKLVLYFLFIFITACGDNSSISGNDEQNSSSSCYLYSSDSVNSDSSSGGGGVYSSDSVNSESSSSESNADSSDSANSDSSSGGGGVYSSDSVNSESSSSESNVDSSDSADTESSSGGGDVYSSDSVNSELSSSEGNADSSDSADSESSSSIEQLGICNTEISDNCQYDILHDIRDDKNYKIVKIGTQWWMAENLNFESAQSRCYGEEKENCEKYGRLYLFSEARNVCPDDWSLPTYSDWNKLKKFIQDNVASNTNLGMTLRSKTGWDETGTGKGLDYFGFNALPGGFYKTLNYDEEYKTVYFWEDNIYEEGAFFVYISYKSMSLGDFVIGYRAGNYLLNYADYAMTSTQRAYYVRCVKE